MNRLGFLRALAGGAAVLALPRPARAAGSAVSKKPFARFYSKGKLVGQVEAVERTPGTFAATLTARSLLTVDRIDSGPINDRVAPFKSISLAPGDSLAVSWVA